MALIRLLIKGTKAEVLTELSKRKMDSRIYPFSKDNQKAFVSEELLPEIADWFNEPSIMTINGYPAGTLLYYKIDR